VTTLRLSLACGPYDRTEALRTGVVRPEGIDLVYVPIQSPPEIFSRMVTTECFDVSEMSCSLYFIRRSRGDFPFVALPVFPSRMFRHGFVFVSRESGIESPKHLEGKRVGVPEYSQTAAVWIRGILQDEYGVDWRTCRWYTGGVNGIGRPDALVEWPRQPLAIERVYDRTLNDMLVAGEIDALIGARIPKALGRDPRVARLFPDYRRVEQDYYRRTGIFPIMHTVVVRESVYRDHPWVVHSLYKAFVASKAWCLEQMRFSGALRYTLPWLHTEIEEAERVLGADPWPYGLEPNRTTLETLGRYVVEQGFVDRVLPLEELFAPVAVVNE
jgi:4,5-dihydroxyphthalate decarboxylase